MNKKALVISGLICLSMITCLTIQPGKQSDSPRMLEYQIQSSTILPPILGYAINITDETELSAFVNKTGSGAEYDPYLIEDMSIYAGVENGHCSAFQLMNTNSYVELNNCYLNGSNKTSAFSANIMLVNCSNVKIFQCISENQTDAAQNILIRNCSNIIIENSTINAEVYDIENICYAINILNSSNIILNATMIKNSYIGCSIDIEDISNAKIQNISIVQNTIINNFLYGILINYNTKNLLIENNHIANNGFSILIVGAENINIHDNEIFNTNIFNAIKVSNGDNVEIYNNKIDYVHEQRLNPVNAIELQNNYNVSIHDNEISRSLSGIVLSIDTELVNLTRNYLHDNIYSINIKNYNYDISITYNFFYYCEIGIFNEGYVDNFIITRNYFKKNYICFYNTTDIEYDFYLSHNSYHEYLELYPLAVFANFTTNVLQYPYYLTSKIVDLYPEYYHDWYSADKFIFIRYFSNYDHQGFFDESLICYINNERLATSTAIINDNIILIRVSDYANVTLKQFLYNYNTSKYIDIGLDISEVVFYNTGNLTSIVHLERNGVSTSFTVSPGSFRFFRFADGIYKLWVTNQIGEIKIAKSNVDIDNEHTSFDVTWSIPLTIPIKLTLNILDYLIGIGMVAIIGIVVFLGVRRKGTGSSYIR